MSRRCFIRSLAVAWVGIAAMATSASAQDECPNKTVRLVVPFAAGGVTDSSARAIAEKLGARLGQTIIVDNRPGASGNLGTDAVARSAPDGCTLLLGFDGTLAINPHVFQKLPFDPLRDFEPITKLGDATLILVAHPSLPANTLQELIALGRSKPDLLSYGTSGTGGTPHLAGELLQQRTGMQMKHVPYKGGGQAIVDVLGGHIPLVYTAVASAQQHVKSGKLKAIAISSEKRTASLPEVPTFAESGLPGFVVDSWVGVLAPARTPRPIVERLQREIAAVLAMPEIRDRYAMLGIEPAGNTPERFAAQLRADYERWERVVKQAQIRVE
ncbi:tripartite tricarboxylate transporter substrate binding protein [Polaromonas sp.]|uniref:Bug family tripartite tricarboxylate transporter substrate binding protein n=1 Tax=Polaromonas sp. TaxID=1869339 RepID=UPI0027317969|nr:tripartite tricarboxylate transporter substrate binding protein [Polaromonas sp.]